MDKINIQPKLNELKDKIKSTDIKLIYLSSPNLVSGQELLEEDFNKILEVIPENTHLILSHSSKPDGRLKSTKALQKLIMR